MSETLVLWIIGGVAIVGGLLFHLTWDEIVTVRKRLHDLSGFVQRIQSEMELVLEKIKGKR